MFPRFLKFGINIGSIGTGTNSTAAGFSTALFQPIIANLLRHNIIFSTRCIASHSDNNFRVAIVGGGLSGLALASALGKSKIKNIVFEKDASFEARVFFPL